MIRGSRPGVLRRCALAACLLLLLVAAKRRAVGVPIEPESPPPQDTFSAAQPADIRTTHLSLDLIVDFTTRQLRGSATHTIANYAHTRRFILDTRDLDIASVTIDGKPADWSLGTDNGWTVPLTIDIEPSTRVVRIAYSTRPSAAALHWLTAKQTLGDLRPFLYTENEPSSARTWIPVQDTPAVRMTYDATVHVPPGMLALMTAPNPTTPNDDGVYAFAMNRTLPPYLIALAVGRLTFRPFDARTGIYAEPELIENAAWDLQEVPDLLDAAESILGPYPFERYDILIPPSFVVGGMENPRINFISPGVVLGNHESPVEPNAFVAHELAHSWGGDLVTCATWSDTWLNEGFATYYEKRIYEALGLPERAELGYYWDRDGFVSALSNLAAESTVLHRVFGPTAGPSSAFNTTSYQKGSLFLKMLDDNLGRAAFDNFIEAYLRRNSFHWVDDQAFVTALEDTALAGTPDLASQLKLEEWIHGTGLPSNSTAPRSARILDGITAQATAFRKGTPASSLNTAGWSPLQVITFLSLIGDLIPTRMSELDAHFGFSSMNTPPVIWLIHTARLRYAPSMPALERFLLSGVPNILPIYAQLAQTPSGKKFALSFYERARDEYAPEIQDYLDSLLKYVPQTLKTAA